MNYPNTVKLYSKCSLCKVDKEMNDKLMDCFTQVKVEPDFFQMGATKALAQMVFQLSS